MSTGKRVLTIGLEPELADFSAFPDLDAQKVRDGLKQQADHLRAQGYDPKTLLIDLGQTAVEVVEAELRKNNYEAILVGAGVRVPPGQFLLFEKLINAIHRHAPQAHICFNTTPSDTAAAFQRWL
jgi:hypothetical protein